MPNIGEFLSKLRLKIIMHKKVKKLCVRHQVGDLIALTVEDGQDWQDVQIPGSKAQTVEKVSAAATPSPSSDQLTSTTSTEPVHVHHFPGIGPATNLLLAQYGIDPQ